VLGVILGPLADENIRRSLMIFEDKPFGFVISQWIGSILILAVIFVIFEGALRVARSARQKKRS
jgi:putative tricarboxylic transport membrane protein